MSASPATAPSWAGIDCPVVRCQRLLGGKWKIVLLYLLSQQDWRFNALQRALGQITAASLNRQLQELVQDDLVERIDYAEIPPRVEYRLTERGRAIEPVMAAMSAYGQAWLAER